MNPLGRKIFGSTLAAGMAVACYWSIRFSYADYLAASDSPARLQEAVRLASGNASYWLHWADLEAARGESATVRLTEATYADPFNADVWIHAGLNAEMNGDLNAAERDLLRAAQLSNQFEPRWTLANYYFRRGDSAHFWPWANSAMKWAYSDRKLLFELCWKMQPDAAVILDRAIPNDPDVLHAYLYFLIGKQLEPSREVARRLETMASSRDRKLLLQYTDWMLDNRRWQDALAAWNALCVRHVLEYRTVVASADPLLTNGEFAARPLNAGFDWRIPRVNGVSVVYSDTPSWLRFDLNGDQPERCVLLHQFVPLAPGKRYVLRFEYRTEQIRADNGLRWKITDAATGKEIPTEPVIPSSEDWAKAGVSFVAPPDLQTARIVLAYERQPGMVQADGSIWLRKVGLEGIR